jgi:hypothetical protein
MTTKGWILAMIVLIVIGSFIKSYLTNSKTHSLAQNQDLYER